MSQLEPDPQFIQGLRLLHSSNKESADQLRNLLDEAIKQKYGLSKMLCNVLHKKYTMEEPVLSDHSSSGGSSKKSKSSSKHSSKSSKSGSPEERASRDTPPDILQSDDNLALEILEDDLTCVICKGMDVGARNRLVECVDCHALYHQECHAPPIQDSQIDVPRLVWYCSNCLKSHQPATKERNSPKTVMEGKTKESKKSGASSKHSEKYKNPSSQSQNGGGGASGCSTNNLPKPNIHIIAGDRRLKDVTKKNKQEKQRGSSTNSSTNNTSSGKHASSSSSSGKNSQDKSHKTKIVAD